MNVAVVHDYLTQRGGAERVVLAMMAAFPRAPLYVSLYEPTSTFPEFAEVDVRPLRINRIKLLRHHHRVALPLLAPAFSRFEVDADVVVCSTSGWAHGVRTRGKKLVYCYTPARWLYQTDRYLGRRSVLGRAALAALRAPLVRWDLRAAASADRYVAISTAVSERVRSLYGIDPEVLPAPHTLGADGPRIQLDDVQPGFALCVSRLLPYKNVAAVIEAFRRLPDARLVIVGSGPERSAYEAIAPPNVRFTGSVADDVLRWLYANCSALVAASYEDFGLTPLEAASFGKPAAVLGWGGFLDTVVGGSTGVFFDEPEPPQIAAAFRQAVALNADPQLLRQHAAAFSPERFGARLRAIAEELVSS